ncbi:MAG TPA: alpha-L-fucosidase [Oscillospiraceae bacterium]|nr:alpha-L-fucosidase [Oscillospiraceae bacterium]HPK36280.1 alpha-L-fucosidase [Oscillospiraceae bacterium]HPR76914.1 alpha-L-fucosidase [Oscillospiraceae bacterium]
MAGKGKSANLRCGLLDFQVGECHDSIPFDPEEYVKASAEAGIQTLVFIGKDAYGCAFYDSDLVGRNASVKSDYLKQAIQAGKKYGVEIYTYFNVLLDDKLGEQFPQYRMINGSGEPVIAYDYYKILCPNSPYFEIAKERIADLLGRYEVQGIFLDITYFSPDTCHCRFCKERFERQYGYALPDKFERGTKELRDFNEFLLDSRIRLLEGLTQTIRKTRDVNIMWNGSGNPRMENEADEKADILSTEFHAPDFTDGLLRVKWACSRGKPVVMSTPYELGSWGDWSILPKESMETVVSMITANGGGCAVNHVPYPSGEFASSVNRSVQEYIKGTYGKVEALEPWLKNTESVSDIAVINSLASRKLSQWGRVYQNDSYPHSLTGAVKMLLESGRHFDVLSEKTFCQNALGYHTAILAGAACLEQETAEAMRDFVKNGSVLIASGPVGLYREDGSRQDNLMLSDLLGVDDYGDSEFSVDYICDIDERISHDIPDSPILAHKANTKAVRVSLRENAVSGAVLAEPLFESSLSRHVYHQHAHPARRSGHPAVVVNQFGKGTCIYFAPEIFSSFHATGSPWLLKMVQNVLDSYCRSTVRVEAPVCPHVSLRTQGGKWIVHLINVSGSRFDLSKSFLTQMIPMHDVKIRIAKKASKVYLVPEKIPLPFTVEGNETTVTIPVLESSRTIVIE